jgi:hypothetical protein
MVVCVGFLEKKAWVAFLLPDWDNVCGCGHSKKMVHAMKFLLIGLLFLMKNILQKKKLPTAHCPQSGQRAGREPGVEIERLCSTGLGTSKNNNARNDCDKDRLYQKRQSAEGADSSAEIFVFREK